MSEKIEISGEQILSANVKPIVLDWNYETPQPITSIRIVIDKEQALVFCKQLISEHGLTISDLFKL